MYKFMIVALVAAMACVVSAADIEIVRQASDINADGSYSWSYETSDHTTAQETGVGGDHVDGSYSYVSPEGELVEVSYKADENGFAATGSHVPEVPEVPEYILRSLEYIRTHPPSE